MTKIQEVPRALLAVAALGIAVLAGIGTADSLGADGSLWGRPSPGSDASGASSGEPTVLRAPAIRGAVGSLTASFEQAVDAGDLETAAGVYAGDAVSSPPGGPPAEGRSAIHSSLETTFPAGSNLEITSREVKVLSPEWASVFGTAVLDREGASATGAPSEVTFLALLRKTDDGWAVVREAVSANR